VRTGLILTAWLGTLLLSKLSLAIARDHTVIYFFIAEAM
jgi:hypothetical protein